MTLKMQMLSSLRRKLFRRALDGAFLPERAGDEDEGDFQAAFPYQAERAQAVEARKVVVGEDQLKIGPIQTRLELLPGLHPQPVAVVTDGLKLSYFEFRIECVVLEDQEQSPDVFVTYLPGRSRSLAGLQPGLAVPVRRSFQLIN